MSDKPEKVGNNVVVSLNYKLTVEGEVVDQSEDGDPIVFLQGHGNIIPGLESELEGMAVGDEKSVVVAAKDAYGEIDPERISDVPKEEFPKSISLKPGVMLEMKDDEGYMMHGRIIEVGDDTVKLDTNHALAGKELHFDVSVAELRAATSEEVDHGHVHDHGHHH